MHGAASSSHSRPGHVLQRRCLRLAHWGDSAPPHEHATLPSWTMPIRYELDDLRRRVVVTVDGNFTPEDFRAILEQRRADKTEGYGILCDLRGMTGEPTIDDLGQFLSAAAQTTRPRGSIAFLATEPLLYARACTYAIMGRSTEFTIEVFRDRIEADDWLTVQAKATDKGGA